MKLKYSKKLNKFSYIKPKIQFVIQSSAPHNGIKTHKTRRTRPRRRLLNAFHFKNHKLFFSI